MRRILLTGICIFLSRPGYAQMVDTSAVVEQIFAHYQKEQPGCQLAITRKGKLIFSKAWGMADLEHRSPMTTASVIEAGSVSKQFTAAAILSLQAQGKLSLEDKLRRYIPELPAYTDDITLEQMIHHTSGLKDWAGLLVFSDAPRGAKLYGNDDVLKLMIRQKSLNHAPGEAFFYSNSNYVLLAIIVERITGLSLAEFTSQFFFRPFGMQHTQWRNDIHRIIPNRAFAYSKNPAGYFLDMPFETVYGSGGLLTTAEDLLKWTNALAHAKLRDSAFLKQQLMTLPLADGKPNNYAAGLRLTKIHGAEVVSHDGATAAYRSLLEYYPVYDVAVAWLSNTSEYDGNAQDFDQLRAFLLNYKRSQREGGQPASQSREVATDNPIMPNHSGALKSYCGFYHSSEVDADLEIVVLRNQLVIKRINGSTFTLDQLSERRFKIRDSSINVNFEVNQKGLVVSLQFSSPKVRNVSFEKKPQK